MILHIKKLNKVHRLMYSKIKKEDIDILHIKNQYIKRLSTIAQCCNYVNFEKLMDIETVKENYFKDYTNFKNQKPFNEAYEEYTKSSLCKENIKINYWNNHISLPRNSDIFVGFYLPKHAKRSLNFDFQIGENFVEKIKLLPGDFRYAIAGISILPIDACYSTPIKIFKCDSYYSKNWEDKDNNELLLIYSQDRSFSYRMSSYPLPFTISFHYNLILGGINCTMGYHKYNFLVIVLGYIYFYYREEEKDLLKYGVRDVLHIPSMQQLTNIKKYKKTYENSELKINERFALLHNKN